jgi:tetratricopeptide (TPR) repeat protein
VIDPGERTPGLAEIALRWPMGRDVLVEAREAERSGDLDSAAASYAEVIRRLEQEPPTLLADRTRASAWAGLGRVDDDEPSRGSAAALFTRLPRDLLDASELSDWASALSQDDEQRQELLAAALAAPGVPSWVDETLGEAALERGEPAAAVAHLERAVLGSPLRRWSYVVLGKALEESGRQGEAALIDTVAAALLTVEGDNARAQWLLEHALDLAPGDLVAEVLRADVLRAGGYRQAVDELRGLSERVPVRSELGVIVIRSLARALVGIGRRRDALAVLEPLVGPDDAAPFDLLLTAQLHADMGADEDACAVYERALAADPRSTMAVEELVRHHLRHRRLAEAKDVVELILTQVDADPFLYVLRGELRHRAGARKAPEADFERAELLGLPRAEAWAQIGDLREREGDAAGAANAFDEAIRLAPDSAEPHRRRGLLAFQIGDRATAIAELTVANRLDPDNLNARFHLSEAHRLEEDLPAALAEVEDVLQRAPERSDFIALRGRLRAAQGETGGAGRDFREALRLDPDLAWAAAGLLELRAPEIGLDEAAAEIVDIVATSGGPSAIAGAANELRRWGLAPACISVVDRYLATAAGQALAGPERASLVMARACAHYDLDGLVDAERDFRETIFFAPGSPQAHVLLGAVLLREGRYADALVELNWARDLDPGSPEVAYWAASALAETGKADAALVELDESIDQIGADAGLLGLRAALLVDLGRDHEALDVIDRLRRLNARADDLDRLEGLASKRAGKPERAVELLEAVVEADPGDTEACVELAGALVDLGRTAEAIPLLDAVPPDDDMAAQARAYRGEAELAEGDREAALEEFTTAVDLDAANAWYRAQLVQTAWELGDMETARRHLDVLLADQSLRDAPEVARLAWLLDDVDTAETRLRQIVADDPDGYSLTLLAGLLLEKGRWDDSFEAAGQALATNPDAVDARLIQADARLGAGRVEDAVVALGTGRDEALVLKRIEILFMLDSGQALEEVDRLLDVGRSRHDVGLLVQIADTLVDNDHHERAVAVLETALAGGPPSPVLLRASGKLLSGIGDFERAVAVLDMARGLDPQETGVDVELAWALSNLASPPLARVLEAAERALERQPDDPWLLKAKADALLLQGKNDGAEVSYMEALEHLDGGTAASDRHSLTGWIHYRLGHYEVAVDHLLRAVATPPSRATGDRLDLGLALLAAGRPSLARRHYELARAELRDRPGDLRRHGLLRVALVDLDEAIGRIDSVASSKSAHELRSMLQGEINDCRPALARIGPFFDRIDALLAAPPGDGAVLPVASESR